MTKINLLAPMRHRVSPRIGRDERRCSKCRTVKPLSGFVSGCGTCRDCRNADARRLRAERNGTASLAREVKVPDGHRVCIACRTPQPVEFFEKAGVKCEPCRLAKRSASQKRWNAANADKLKVAGKSYKRRARCAQQIKRLQENVALLQEAAEKPAMVMTHGRSLMVAPDQVQADFQELAGHSAEEQAEALRWDAELDTRNDLPRGLRALVEKWCEEVQANQAARMRDPVYMAALAAQLATMLISDEEVEATQFNNSPDNRRIRAEQHALDEEDRKAMKAIERARMR